MAVAVPTDKGTTLVLLLAVVGTALALRRDGTRPGVLVALAGLLVASGQGLAGEEGVPVVAVLVVALAGALLVRRTDAYAVIAAVAALGALCLLQLSPADASSLLSGGPLHTGEARFLAVGGVLLGAVGAATAALAWRRDDRVVAGGAVVLVGLGAIAHGVAFVGAVT